ncbi:hypothetical protein JCM19301_3250 [Jejuia pallidilutea]|uniref:Uncharacterized protein n=1 Tax=Jejuia pallidilutea TaxID=504487 RepID=A0A090VXH4_9FLAO|nr:hypothetical protein JCM19301_3250 [Jejuia pallidilutea]
MCFFIFLSLIFSNLATLRAVLESDFYLGNLKLLLVVFIKITTDWGL